MSPLLRSKILGPFVSTLTVDDKYRPNKENFLTPTQMQLCQKPKTLWNFDCGLEIYKKSSSFWKKKDEPV